MISAVLDANVLVSGFVANRGGPAELIAAWFAGEFDLVLSEHILEGTARLVKAVLPDTLYACRGA